MELAQHKEFTVATNGDPQSPWQRGTNENTNRLLRQYFPRGTELSGHSQADLDAVALQLNQRPKKTLGYKSPAERFQKMLRRPVEPAHPMLKNGTTYADVGQDYYEERY